VIGEREMIKAATGHVAQLGVTLEHVDTVFELMGIDTREFRGLAQSLSNARGPADEGCYLGGFIDGFLLGVRSARSETNGRELILP
jgi:hypothetical protein